jgi:preprotein translocase SecF subunit
VGVFDVISKRRWFYLLSLLITVPGLFFILLTPVSSAGLQFTIDYTGGTQWEIRFQDPNVTTNQVEAVFAQQGLQAVAVTTSSGFIQIKTEQIAGLIDETPTASAAPSGSPSASSSAAASGSPGASPSPVASASPSTAATASPSAAPSATPAPTPSPSPTASPSPSLSPAPSGSPGASGAASPGASSSPAAAIGDTKIPTVGKLGEVAAALQTALGPIAEQRSLTTIGAVVSADLILVAIQLIIVGSIGILLWITYRFRDVKFGVTALIALLHDVIVVVGTFAILGTFFHVEIDALFVTAMLTVIGFSVHDTIVVFDRVRENKARHAGEPFADIVNHSILQTFGRSIMTSLTVVLTLLALLLFGGSAISDFILALLIGIISGTYSSIFVAAPLLVDWQLWDDRRHGRLTAPRSPRARRTAS